MLELISKYITIFALSTFKFMFAPYMGKAAGFSFLENHIVTFLGAGITSTIFFHGASYFNERARKKRIIKDAKRVAQGKKPKKKFTRANKIVIKIKTGIGFYGLGVFAPIFLSVPIGSIVVAKFYSKKKIAFWYVLFVLYMYSLISCLIADVWT